MAFFSKKKHNKDQQAGSASGASGGGVAGTGPTQASSGLNSSANSMGTTAATHPQQPAMYVSSARSDGSTGMAGPSVPYNNAPPFDGNRQQQALQQYSGSAPQQQQQGYPQYMPYQQGLSSQSAYPGNPGSGALGNGMVAGVSNAAYGQNGSPQQSNYPNGIGISVPPSGGQPGIGLGALPGRNFSANSNSSFSNGAHNTAPPLQPLPASGPPAQASSSSHHAQTGPHSSPVSYPWSQRPIRLQPIQLARPNGSDVQAPLSSETSPSPFPRYGHSVNPIAQSATGDLYLFGGLVKDQVSNDLFMVSCSNPNPTSAQSNESKALAGAPINVSLIETRGERPCARVGHASVSVGNVLIIWGGDTKTREEDPQDNNLYLLNLGSREWTLVKVTGPSPQGRYGHAAAMRGSKFYVFGGQQDLPPGAPDDAAFLNDLWCFDLQNLKAGKPHWQQIQYASETPAPPKRTGHTMVNYSDKLYVFGGTDGQYHYNDTWCFTPATNSWSELSCIGYIPVPREGHAATLVDDVVYVFGGRSVDGKDLEDLAAFKISNQRWYMFTNMGPAPSGRSGHAMATWHNKVFVLGGESYTSTKHEWPNMINMLDTGKIKYPSDSRSQQSNRKPSNSRMHQSSQNPASSMQQPNVLSTSANNKTLQSATNDELRRAVSPTGSERDASLMRSIDRTAANSTGVANGSPTARDSSSIQEPTRPGVDPRRALSPVNEHQSAGETGRSLSPSGTRPAQFSNSFTTMSNGHTAYSTPPTRHDATLNGLPNTTSPPNPQLNALRANARSPSPQLTKSLDSHSHQTQPDTFHSVLSGSGPSHSSQSATSSTRDKWLQMALADAVQQGYNLPAGSDSFVGETKDSNNQLHSAFLAMKREIASLRKTMAEDAQNAEQLVTQASKGKTIALQEAAFYRAKIAALESNAPSELAKLERSRMAELERKLSETASAKSALEHRLSEVESELNHHRDTAQAAVEREQAASSRAEAAESSYSRSLTEYAELQRRAHVHESSTHEHSSQLASLKSQVEQLTAQNENYTERLREAEAEVEKHILALDEVHVSLTSITNHSSEFESLWQKSREELIEQQGKVARLEAEMHKTASQLEASQSHVMDLERALHAAQEEAVSLRSLSTGHLQQLLDFSRNRSSANVGKDSKDAESTKALQGDLDTHRSLADEAHARAASAQTELRDAKAAHIVLEKQVTLLRNELTALRARHASSVEAASRAQALVTQREMDLRDKARAIEACEVKNGLLRNILVENGLSVDEHGSPKVDEGFGSGSNTTRKIAELEARLDQRNQAYEELQSMHDDARQEAESAQQRLRSSEEQIDHLSREIQSLQMAESNSAGLEDAAARSTKAEADLAALQEKHQQLETTHLKAVQYVKGTEKMFRRMKDELTRYKEQNETLERELSNFKGSSGKGHARKMSAELRPELEDLRAQLTALRQQSDTSSNHNEELQEHIARLKSEYDQQLSQQQRETSTKLQECESEIEELREALARVQREVEETLAHNKQLETELQKLTDKPND